MTKGKARRPGTRPGTRPSTRSEVTRLVVDADVDAAVEAAVGAVEIATDEQAGVDTRNVPPPEGSELTSALRVVLFEDNAYVSSLQSAVAASGHTVVVAGAGRDGQKRVLDAIRTMAVDVVIVALPGGEAVLEAALAIEPRRPVVIASVAGNPVISVQRATSAGADLVVMRPHDVSSVAPVLFAAQRLTIERRVTVAARGAEQALRARLDELADPEPRGFLPVELFQRVLELELRRAKRFEYPLSVALFAVDVAPPPPPPGIRGILRARAGNVLIHTVRDIDIATQLDHERFLVLLPYTDLKGAVGLAKRAIGAVATGDPVVAAGRKYPPKIIAAIAGANLAKPTGYTTLVKDVSRVLEGAKREGAELAVQP